MKKKTFLLILLIATISLSIEGNLNNLPTSGEDVHSNEKFKLNFKDLIEVPTKTNSRKNCFYDNIGSIIQRLQTSINDYIMKCDLTNKKNLDTFYKLTLILSEINAVRKFSFQEIPQKIKEEVKTLDTFKSVELHSSLREIIEAFDKKANFERQIEFALRKLPDELDLIIKKNNYPLFMRNNFWLLIETTLTINSLEILYDITDRDKCLPPDWDGIKNSNALIHNGNFLKEKSNEIEIQKLKCKTDFERIHIQPFNFQKSGIVLTWWGSHNYKELRKKKITVLRGYDDNHIYIEYTIFMIEDFIVGHLIEIDGKRLLFKEKLRCFDYYFTMISVQKDCDKYKVIISIRYLSSNSRQSAKFYLNTNGFESLVLDFDQKHVMMNDFYDDFTYSIEKELILMSENISKNNLIEKLKKHSKCRQDCKYSKGKKCVICNNNNYQYNGECLDKCPDGTYSNFLKQCKKCHKRCEKCLSKENLRCLKCKSGFTLHNDKCIKKCPPGKYSDGFKCINCGDNCLKCSSLKTCSICEQGNYLQNGKCVKECDKGYFKDLMSRSCEKCHLNCEECTSFSKCKIPSENCVLHHGRAVCVCPKSFYKDLLTVRCERCSENCDKCLNNINCEKCADGFILNKAGLCETHCPKEHINVRGTCVKCENNCQICYPSNISDCKKCKKGFFLSNKKCVLDCKEGSFVSEDSVCVKCDTAKNCKNCNQHHCLECEVGFFMLSDRTCSKYCPDGSTVSISGKKCVKCEDRLCKKCSNESLGTCTKCYEDHLLYKGKCIEECPKTTFKTHRKCENCMKGCEKCREKNLCIRCSKGYFRFGEICYEKCPEGFKSNHNRECVKCEDDNCHECQNEVNKCEKCKNGYHLFNNKCYSKCPLNTFKTLNNNCSSCKINCEKCKDKFTCEKCRINYVLQNNDCLKTCDKGFYPMNGSKCVKCHNKNCEVCGEDLQNCYRCKKDFLLFEGKCVRECPSTTFKLKGSCFPCISPCKECHSATKCNSCIKNFFLKGFECVSNCNKGETMENNNCVNCADEYCEECSSSLESSCLKCQNRLLYKHKCYETCPKKTFRLSGQCLDCPENCDVCRELNLCEKCTFPFLLLNSKCVKKCPPGFTQKGDRCVECKGNCKSCLSNNLGRCVSCFKKMLIEEGKCVSECSSGFFNDGNGNCEKCGIKDCRFCENLKVCRECIRGKILDKGKCVKKCGKGFTKSKDRKKCKKCVVKKCEKCLSANHYICLKCELDSFLYKNQCVEECPTGTYKAKDKKRCKDCSNNCRRCKNAKECYSCNYGFFLNSKEKCVEKCPDSTVEISDKCVNCRDEKCKKCDKDNLEICRKCISPYVLNKITNKCQEKCPKRTFVENGECHKCGLFCRKCDKSRCLECDKGKTLLDNGKCVDNCPTLSYESFGRCLKCEVEENCKKCDELNKKKCIECNSGYLLEESKCVKKCGINYYEKDGNCVRCTKNCKICRNDYTCDRCKKKFYVFNGKCVERCKKGYYSSNHICRKCGEGCVHCNSMECFECERGMLIQDGYCVNQCDSGYFKKNLKCVKCSNPECDICSNFNKCLKCRGIKILKKEKCVEKCGDGYFEKDSRCVKCLKKKCLSCDSTNPERCLKCKKGYFLLNETCVQSCPITTYLEKDNCLKCLKNCRKCENPTTCLKCSSGFKLSINKSECLHKCPKKTMNNEGFCVKCENQDCLKCNERKDKCTLCEYPKVLDDGECKKKCPKGKYFDKFEQRCLKCAFKCEECELESDNCVKCEKGFAAENGKCKNPCKIGKRYILGNCEKCGVEDCKYCTDNLQFCGKCIKGKVLSLDGKCIDSCKEGSYLNSAKKCEKCENGCKICKSSNICETCEKGLALQDGKCKKNCSKPYFEKNGICVKCQDKECGICDKNDLTKCLKCKKSLILHKNKCITKCPPESFSFEVSKNNKKCLKCFENCDICENQFECLKCKNGFYLRGNKCVRKCLKGETIHLDIKCKPCTKNCLKCSKENEKKCLECRKGYYLKSEKCVRNCGEGYRTNKFNRKCEKCSIRHCIECQNNIKNCERCKGKMFYSKGECVHHCKKSSTPNKILRICTECKANNCDICDPENPLACKKCNEGFSLNNLKQCKETCEKHEYTLNGKCVKCPLNCKECSDGFTCTKCHDTKKLKDGECADGCEKGKVMIDGECKKCKVSGCWKCSETDRSVCLFCKIGFYLFEDKCVSKCPKESFSQGNVCIRCSIGCEECDEQEKCLKCNEHHFLQNGKCLKNCFEGFYHKQKSNKCEKCKDYSKVKKCDEKKPIECREGYFLDEEENKCVKRCKEGRYEDTLLKKCVKCSEKCEKCESGTNCQRCKLDYVILNSKCVKECPEGFIKRDYKCLKCENHNCKTCEPIDLSKCISCKKGLLLKYNKCVKECGKGYLVLNKKCVKCPIHCKICENQEKCLKCRKTMTLTKDGKCVSKCKKGYTFNSEGICKLKCEDPNCLVCSETDPKKCFECKNFLFNNMCFDSCEVGTRSDLRTKKCVNCSKNCRNCDESSCTKCFKGFFHLESNPKYCGSCQKDGRHLIIENKCKRCKILGCKKCESGNDLKCEKCESGKVLINGLCKEKCDSRHFKLGQFCKKCMKNCSECEDGDSCLKCDFPFILHKDKCVMKCPRFYVNIKEKCVRCSSKQCEECKPENPSICVKCTEKSLIFNKTCHKKCPDGSFAEPPKCVQCPSNCKYCLKGVCLKCDDPFKLKENDCVKECGNSFYNDDKNECRHCKDTNCEKCDKDKCLKCKFSSFLIPKGRCVQVCPDEFYTDIKESKCVRCPKDCKECNKEKCLTCHKGSYLFKGKCIEKCPESTTKSNGKCVNCSDKNCKICSDSSPENCEICKSSFILSNNSCLTKCPKGSYPNPIRTKCKECDKKCEICESKTACKECKREFYLVSGYCMSKCPDGKVLLNNKCIECSDSNCSSCRENLNECLICKDPYLLFDRSCRIRCPVGFYSDKLNRCQKCGIGCEACKDSKECFKCMNGFFMNNDRACVKDCGKGLYGQCDENVCRKCNEACEECDDESPFNCHKCSKNFYKSGNGCVSEKQCRKGTFADKKTGNCELCKIDYCAECNDKKECLVCLKGYEKDLSGNCIESHNFIPVISSKPLLVSTYSKIQMRKFSKDLNGIGIGSDNISLSFWIRRISFNNEKVKLFSIKSNSSLFKEINLEIGNNNQCQFYIKTNFNHIEKKISDCSFEKLFDFALFVVRITKSNSKITVISSVKFSDGIKTRTNFDHDFQVEGDLIIEDSTLEFGNQEKSSEIFEIADFRVSDFPLSEKEIDLLFNDKPLDCDYNCDECIEKCLKCNSNKLAKNGYCEPVFVSVRSDYLRLEKRFRSLLKRSLDHRLDSDRYAVVSWFWLDKLGGSFINLKYPNQEILSVKTKINGVLVISINHQEFEFPNIIFKEKEWNFVGVAVEMNSINVWAKNLKKLKIFNSIAMKGKALRLTEDVEVFLEKKQSLSDLRLYVNNIPLQYQIDEQFKNFKIDPFCEEIGEDRTCFKCKKGKILSEDKKCVDSLEQTPIDILQKVSIFNKDEIQVSLPINLVKNRFSIRICIRKKFQSILNQSHNLISFKNSNTVEAVVIEKVEKYGFSKLIIKGDNEENYEYEYDYSSGKLDWICFVAGYESNQITWTINGAKERIFTTSRKSGITGILLGDKEKNDINYEFAKCQVFPSILNHGFIKTLKDPKDCDPACVDCDYDNGLCKKCVTGTKKGYDCETFLLGYKSAYLYHVRTMESSYANSFNLDISSKFNKDINSEEYSVIGNFKILDIKDILLNKKSFYTIFALSNRENELKPNPSKYLISLEISSNDAKPFYQWRISDGNEVQLGKIEGLEVHEDQWISFQSTIRVNKKKLLYSIKSEKKTNQINGTIKLEKYPNRMNERSVLSLLGVNINQGDNYRLLDVVYYYFYIAPNLKYYPSIIEKFTHVFKLPPKLNLPNTKLAIRDLELDKEVVLECNPGFTNRNNKCEKHQEIEYFLLTDQTTFIFTGDKNIELPYINSSKKTLGFYARKNYAGLESLKPRNVIEAGNLVIKFISSQSGCNSWNFKIKGTPFTISFNEADCENNKDYSYYEFLLHFDLDSFSVLVKGDHRKLLYKNTITINSNVDLGSKLLINDLNEEITIYGLFIASGHLENSVLSKPSEIPENNAFLSFEGKSKACLFGVESNGKCKPNAIKIPIFNSNKKQTKIINLIKYLRNDIPLRINEFTISFTLSMKDFTSEQGKNILRIRNNNKRNSNPVSSEEFTINDNLMVLKFIGRNRIFVGFTNRVSQSTSASIQGFTSPSFTSDLINQSINFILKITKNKFYVNCYNSEYSILKYSEKINGINDYLSRYSSLLFAEDFEQIATFTNFSFFTQSIPHSTLIKLSKSLHYLKQQTCKSSNSLGCVKCETNRYLNSGVCFGSNRSKVIFNEFTNIRPSKKVLKFEENIWGKSKNYGFSFMFRESNFKKNRFKITTIKEKRENSKENSSFTLFIEDNSLFFEYYNNGLLTGKSNIHRFNGDDMELGWHYIRINFDRTLPKRRIKLFILNKNKNSIKSVEVETEKEEIKQKTHSNILISIKFGEKHLSPNDNYRFDIKNVMFLENEGDNSTEEYLRLIPQDTVTELESCLDKSKGTCSQGKRSFSIQNKNLIVDPRKDFKKTPLYYNIIKSKSIQRWSNYLIGFDVDFNSCLTDYYKENSNVLFNLIQQNDRQILSQKMNDVISDSQLKFSSFSIIITQSGLRFYFGSNNRVRYTSQFNFFLGETRKSIKTLKIQALINTEEKKATIVLYIDNLKTLLEFNTLYSPEALYDDQLVYSHPSVSNVRIHVLDKANFNYDYNNFINEESKNINSYNSGLCSNSNCEKCVSLQENVKLFCEKCSKHFALWNGECLKNKN